MTTSPLSLHGRVHQNLHLAAGAETVDALLTVDAHRRGRAAPPPAAEVVVVDGSLSMSEPASGRADGGPTKLDHAVAATEVAVATLRDGVDFAVIVGTHEARMVYPSRPGTEPAGERTRAEAVAALRALRARGAEGGTAIGTWLDLARAVLARHPGAIRQAILLTDGRDESESEDALAAAVTRCTGAFRCDCRGVGAAWSVAELRAVARALIGTCRQVARPSDLAADFRETMAYSMDKQVAELALQVHTPVGARVTLVKQTAPGVVVDLSSRREGSDPRRGLYRTGPWGTEERDFHVAVSVPAAEVGNEKRACRLSFVEIAPDGIEVVEQSFVHTGPDGGRESLGEAVIRAIWTDDPDVDTAPHPLVRLSSAQGDLEREVDRVVAARRADRPTQVDEWLGAVRERAARSGLDELVDRIDAAWDPATGTFALDDDKMIDIQIESSSLSHHGSAVADVRHGHAPGNAVPGPQEAPGRDEERDR